MGLAIEMVTKKPIKKRAITYARRYPGQSATQIANALKANPSTVSSVLYAACKAGELVRSERVALPGGWWGKGGGGPAGGHVYGPVPK